MIPSATSANSTGNRTNISQDFKTKFVKIGSSEQRRVYKAEFNKDYNRYMVLHGQLQRVSQRFAKMQRKLKQTPETSPEYQRLKKMIMDEYRTQQSSGFKRDQDEFQYLHQKLAHIKKLVHDFDTSGGSNKKLSKSTNHQSSSSRQNNHQILQASS
jgi:RNA polymerase II elongation factor ELL